MSFLHPGLVWLLPLAAVPIILHLLTLHRLKTIELATFRFLFDSYVQQRRQLKFLEALLAALRTAFVLFLVVMFMRPLVRPWAGLFGGGAGRDVVMLVDCSASMNARVGGVAAIDRARSTAGALADRLAATDRLTLVRITARAETVFTRFAGDTRTIREHIESLRASPARANLFAAFQELFGSSAKRRPGQLVYLFTDCQSSAWRELKDRSFARLLPADVQFTVLNVGSNEPLANRAVTGEVPREARVVAGLPLLLRPRVINHSKTETAHVTVGVSVDDKEVDRVTFGIKPGAGGSGEVVYRPMELGVHRGRFEIAGDPFPDDDTFLFTLEVVPALKVLLVNGAPAADPFENEALYVSTALQAQPDRPAAPVSGDLTPGTAKKKAARPRPPAKKPAAEPDPVDLGPGADFVRSLEVQEIAENQLNPTMLQDASLVILANTGGLNAERFGWLRDYVAGGGGLLVFPGDKVNPDVFSKQFFAATAPVPSRQQRAAPRDRRKKGILGQSNPAEPLIAATMAAPVGDPAKLDDFEKLTRIDYAHPLLAVFEDPAAKYLTTARFYRRFPLELSTDAGNTWALAHFSGGKPALLESRYGDGTVLLAAFAANAKWSNLPLRPEFVPLVLRMASYVMRPPDVDGPSVVPSGAPAEVSVALSWAPASARFSDPDRHVTQVTLQRAEQRLAGAFAHTGAKGYYTAEIHGGRAEQPRAASLAFAVNLPPEESDFTLVTEQNLRDWFPGRTVKLVDASAEAQQQLGPIGEQREIWRPLIWLLFAIIGVEFLLATSSGRRDEEAPTVSDRIRAVHPGTWVGRMTGAGTTQEP
jgi:hypothetical protein